MDHQLPPCRLLGPSDGLRLLLLQTLQPGQLRADWVQVCGLHQDQQLLLFWVYCSWCCCNGLSCVTPSGIRRLKEDAFPTVFDSSSTIKCKRPGALQTQEDLAPLRYTCLLVVGDAASANLLAHTPHSLSITYSDLVK